MEAVLEISAVSQFVPAFPWYIVHCVGAQDSRVEHLITKMGWEFYQPKCRELRPVPLRQLAPRQRNSALPVRRPVDVPLFPRYPFIRCDLDHPDRHEIFDMLGIKGLICSGGKPQPHIVSEILINAFKQNESGGALPAGTTIAQLSYRINEIVRITSGPFAGFDGVVQEHINIPIEELDEKARIKLLVGMFGGLSLVEMALGYIEKLK